MIINSKHTKVLALALAATVSLSSCLKNTGYEDALTDNPAAAVMIADAASEDSKSFALNSTPLQEKFDAIRIFLGDQGLAKKDYLIKVSKNAGLIADYNTANSTGYIELPANAYTGSFDVTVKAGTNVVDLPITLDKTKIDLSSSYALGLQIADASGAVINPNANKIVIIIGVKNKYDGVYTFKGRIATEVPGDRPASFLNQPFTYPVDIELITSGASSVKMRNPAFGLEGFHPLINNGGISGFGSTRPEYVFDNADKLVSVANIYPNPTNGRAFIANPAITTNRYVAGSKTVYAGYFMTQPSFQPLPLYDTLIYKGPRP
ncbi:MAG: DUF1735 domain-containing protein [Sphingobacteriales bacterium]|nr:MAG: DUF1735 domain-containing protein [Sphingobacteriales bacterium]